MFQMVSKHLFSLYNYEVRLLKVVVIDDLNGN